MQALIDHAYAEVVVTHRMFSTKMPVHHSAHSPIGGLDGDFVGDGAPTSSFQIALDMS